MKNCMDEDKMEILIYKFNSSLFNRCQFELIKITEKNFK